VLLKTIPPKGEGLYPALWKSSFFVTALGTMSPACFTNVSANSRVIILLLMDACSSLVKHTLFPDRLKTLFVP